MTSEKKDNKIKCLFAQCMEDGFCNNCKKHCDGAFKPNGHNALYMDASAMCGMVTGKIPEVFYVNSEQAEGLIKESKAVYASIKIPMDEISKYICDDGPDKGKVYKIQLFFVVHNNPDTSSNNEGKEVL